MDELYMRRCLDLAASGAGYVSPNPLVGSVIVHNNKIIGEGYHRKAGQAHAEVNAINSVKDKSILKQSSIYINLEPCSHFGKTPPCTDLIIRSGIEKVFIGTRDTFSLVNGGGIEKLKKVSCNVEYGILEKECREINKRFFCFHEKKRPYVILKWAETADGFVDKHRTIKSSSSALKITDNIAGALVHRWRSEEDSILIGSNTAIMDDPSLNVRLIEGRDPVRLVVDKNHKIPGNLKIFDGSIPTIVFTKNEKAGKDNIQYVKTDFNNSLNSILNTLFNSDILSVLVEGGPLLHKSFIDKGLWDEARILTADFNIAEGVPSPTLKGKLEKTEIIGNSKLRIYKP